MNQILLNIFFSFSLYLSISVGFVIIYYPTRFFHIAHAITLTFAAYFTYLFSMQLTFPLTIAIPLAILAATAVGMLSKIALYKPLRKRNASPMILMIASLGL